jgi:hypothetical protein
MLWGVEINGAGGGRLRVAGAGVVGRGGAEARQLGARVLRGATS